MGGNIASRAYHGQPGGDEAWDNVPLHQAKLEVLPANMKPTL